MAAESPCLMPFSEKMAEKIITYEMNIASPLVTGDTIFTPKNRVTPPRFGAFSHINS